MRSFATGRQWFSLRLVLLFASLVHAGAQTATVRGTARDGQGVAVRGAAVVLTCDTVPARSARTLTAADGTYRLAALLPCDYRLSASLADAASTSIHVAVSATGDLVRDLTLLPGDMGQPANVSTEKPKFEASGIRGLIDPGGYSAPANAAAASGLLSGLADVEHDANAAPTRLSCAAEPDLVRAVAQQPASALANRSLAEFYLDHDAFDKALTCLQTAQQLNPQDAQVHLDAAEALLALRRFEEARAQLQRVPNDPHNVRLHRLLAKVDEGSGQFRQASAEYVLLRQIQESEENSFGAGYEMLLDGRPAQAGDLFRDGLLRHPRSVALLLGAGSAEFLQGHAPASIALFLQAAELEPSDPRPYPFLAAAFAASPTQAERAIASARRHVELAPQDAEGLVAYASLLEDEPGAQQGTTARETRALLQRAIALRPDLAQAHFELGVLYARAGENDNAIAELESALQLDPSRVEVHYRLSLVLRRSGDRAKADRELTLFQQARPESNAADEVDVRRFLSVLRPSKGRAEASKCGSASSVPALPMP